MSDLSEGQRLAKRNLKRYYDLVEDRIFDLDVCNLRLKMAVEEKDELSAERFQEELVGKVFSLSFWGGLEPNIFEIMPIVKDGVDYTTREEFIHNLSWILAHPII